MARRDAAFGLFSDAQAITALAQASSNVMDLTDFNHQIGQAVKVPILAMQVHTTFTAPMTVFTARLQGAVSDAGPWVPLNIILELIPIALMLEGNQLCYMPLPAVGVDIGGPLGPAVQGQTPSSLSFSPLCRFIRWYYTADAIPTDGAIDAWLDIQ